MAAQIATLTFCVGPASSLRLRSACKAADAASVAHVRTGGVGVTRARASSSAGGGAASGRGGRRGVVVGGVVRSAAIVVGAVAVAVVAAARAMAASGGGREAAILATRRGMHLFTQGDVKASVAEFDKALEFDSRQRSYLWQRGLSLYYLNRFEEGAMQFREDVAVNPNDTEESIWCFLCEAQLFGLEEARKRFLEVGRDSRPVMRAAYELFRDGGDTNELLNLASTNAHDFFYAYLYVGLYHEAKKETEAAKDAMIAAVSSPYGLRGISAFIVPPLLVTNLTGNGCVLPSEHRAALDISLKVKKQDAGLQTLALWGRIFTTTGNDYILAEGCVSAKRVGRKLTFDTKYYFTQDGVLWLDLQPPENEDRYHLCKSAKGPFTGDPANVFLVVPDPIEPSEYDEFVEPALEGDKSGSSATDEKTGSEDEEKPDTTDTEGEDGETSEDPPGEPEEAKVIEDEEVAEGEGEGEEGEGEEIPAGIELPELERLVGLMKWIDEECGVVPFNGLVLTPNDVLIKNTAFTGPKFADELDSYCHLFTGYMTAPLSKDLPGSWSIHSIPLQNDVVVRSLVWPGYFLYYSATNHDYGSVYFGFGEKNKDIAFGVP